MTLDDAERLKRYSCRNKNVLRSPSEKKSNILHIPYISIETRIIDLHFAADSIGLSSFKFL